MQPVRLRWIHATDDRPQRTVAPFEVVSEYTPAGDQPAAIADLSRRRIRAGEKDVVLLGATGTGKSATTAWLIEQVQRPTLVHGAQQDARRAARQRVPRADAEQRRRVLRLATTTTTSPRPTSRRPTPSSRRTPRSTPRSSGCGTRATNSLLSRRDVIVVADGVVHLRPRRARGVHRPRWSRCRSASTIDRDELLRRFIDMQYNRNDVDFSRGKFRVRGDTIEIIPVYEEHAIRIEMFGDEIEALYTLHPLTGEVVREEQEMSVFPATHYVAGPERDAARDRRRSRPSWRSGWPSSRSRASCSRRSGCACARRSTSR